MFAGRGRRTRLRETYDEGAVHFPMVVLEVVIYCYKCVCPVLSEKVGATLVGADGFDIHRNRIPLSIAGVLGFRDPILPLVLRFLVRTHQTPFYCDTVESPRPPTLLPLHHHAPSLSQC